MRKLVAILFVCTFLFTGNLFAQKGDLKFGHINSVEILSMMPERDSARMELQKYSQMLNQEMEAMQVEYSNKLQQYYDKQETYTNLVRQAKESELQDLERRIQQFQSSAQQDYSQKEAELLQPIMKKLEDAINKVGEEHGFIYIFDVSSGGVVFHSDKSVNALPLVKKELGLE